MAKVFRGFLVGLALGIIFSILVANASNHETGAGPSDQLGFKVSGHHFLTKGSNFRKAYVSGVVDAFLVSTHMADTGKQVFNFKNCVENRSANEIMTFVDRYLHENKSQRNQSTALVTHKALESVCLSQTSPVVDP